MSPYASLRPIPADEDAENQMPSVETPSAIKPDRFTPSGDPRFRAFTPVAPSDSFVDKHPDGVGEDAIAGKDRRAPAMLTAYWPNHGNNRRNKASSFYASQPQSARVSRHSEKVKPVVNKGTQMEIEILRQRLRSIAYKNHFSWEQLFDKFDTDKSGVLSHSQFEHMLVITNKHHKPTQINAAAMRNLFHSIDYEGHGNITHEEFEHFVEGESRMHDLQIDMIKQRIVSATHVKDWHKICQKYREWRIEGDTIKQAADDVVELSFENVCKIIRVDARVSDNLVSLDELEQMFNAADDDKSGSVSLTEFGNFMMKTSATFVDYRNTVIRRMWSAGREWKPLFRRATRKGTRRLGGQNISADFCTLVEFNDVLRFDGNLPKRLLSDRDIELLFYSVSVEEDVTLPGTTGAPKHRLCNTLRLRRISAALCC
jgi:Ca2+-binding EF-hand superfamily protein